MIILYEKLLGEISFTNLINEIKKINNEINIFFILENKNNELETLLKNNNIKNIFYIDEINVKDLIKEIKDIKLNNNEKLFEEIETLKNIIKQKDDELTKYKNNNLENKKMILIIGCKNVGKTTILSNFQVVKNNNFEFVELDIDDYFEVKKRICSAFKIIFILEMSYEKIKINKNKIEKIILNNKINYNNVYVIFNKINNYSINKKIAKNILEKIKILGYIKFSNYCDYKINEKNNYDNENKKLKIYYSKILNKLN